MKEFKLRSPVAYKKLLESDDARDKASLMVADFEVKITEKIKEFQSEKELQGFISRLYSDLGKTMKKAFEVVGKTEGKFPGNTKGWKRDFWDAAQKNCGVDHPRDRGEKIVFHPYKLHSYQLDNLVDVCNQMDLKMWISGESEYFPGHTIKVNIKQNEED